METLKPKFVDAIPEHLDRGILYVSMNRSLALHLCICGCGNEVITPFSPTDWELRFYGSSISLYPSIGNWEFPCRAHYWIRNNNIIHAGTMNTQQIQAGRQEDKLKKKEYYKNSVELETTAPAFETTKPWYSQLSEFIKKLLWS